MKTQAHKIFFPGLAGGLALNAGMLLTFRTLGFGWNGGGILLDQSIQSKKLIAVWTEIEPIPLVVSDPTLIISGLILFGFIHAFIYSLCAPAWPQGVCARAWRMSALLFSLSFLFWEFFTPFNMFGEPLMLIGLELVFWAAIAMAEAFAIALVFERLNA